MTDKINTSVQDDAVYEKGYQGDKVLVVSFGHMLHDIYSAFLAPLVPLLVAKLGISLALGGMLDSIRNLPSLLNPLFGYIVDKLRTRYFIILTPVVTAITMSLLGLAPSYAVACILLLVMGISASFFHVPAPVMIKRFAGTQTGRGMSWYMLAGESSRTLGPLIITGAITVWGLEGTWKLIPFSFIASFLLYLKLKNVELYSSRHKDDSDAGTGIREMLPLFGSITGYTSFMMALKIAVTLYLPAYLLYQGKSLVEASFMLSVLQFAGAAGTFFAGSISDKIGRKNTLYISGLICPVLMWTFLKAPEEFYIPILAVLGFFLFASGPVLLALVQDAGARSPALANGLYMTINFSVRALVVFIVGVLVERFGYEAIYFYIVFWSLGVLPLIFMIPEKRA